MFPKPRLILGLVKISKYAENKIKNKAIILQWFDSFGYVKNATTIKNFRDHNKPGLWTDLSQ